MPINHHQDCDVYQATLASEGPYGDETVNPDDYQCLPDCVEENAPLAHNTARTADTIPVVIEHPVGYPFEPGERERDWHVASDEEYAAYVAYWNDVYDRGEE